MRLRFSRRAEADLDEIAAYIARDNPGRAVTFIAELREHCRGLVMFPEARRLRPELGEGVRLSVFGNYVVLYVAHRNVLEIRRVVHGARNLADID
jgi:toxin ParE1/3/4